MAQRDLRRDSEHGNDHRAGAQAEIMSEAAFAGPPDQRADAAPVFRGRYPRITSYKRDGRGVATPVWFVQQDGGLLVETDAASGKVSASAATAGPGGGLDSQRPTARRADAGRGRDPPRSETGAVERLIADKCRFDMIIFRPLRFVQARLHLGRPRTPPAILRSRPATGSPAGGLLW